MHRPENVPRNPFFDPMASFEPEGIAPAEPTAGTLGAFDDALHRSRKLWNSIADNSGHDPTASSNPTSDINPLPDNPLFTPSVGGDTQNTDRTPRTSSIRVLREWLGFLSTHPELTEFQAEVDAHYRRFDNTPGRPSVPFNDSYPTVSGDLTDQN